MCQRHERRFGDGESKSDEGVLSVGACFFDGVHRRGVMDEIGWLMCPMVYGDGGGRWERTNAGRRVGGGGCGWKK